MRWFFQGLESRGDANERRSPLTFLHFYLGLHNAIAMVHMNCSFFEEQENVPYQV
jgi:hypothetical protein